MNNNNNEAHLRRFQIEQQLREAMRLDDMSLVDQLLPLYTVNTDKPDCDLVLAAVGSGNMRMFEKVVAFFDAQNISVPYRTLSSGLAQAARLGLIDMVMAVEKMIDEPANTKIRKRAREIALDRAICDNQLEVIKFLVGMTNFRVAPSPALFLAIGHGSVDALRFLVTIVDVRTHGSKALVDAARMGRLEMVQILAPLSKATEQDSLALQYACQAGKSYQASQQHVQNLIGVLAPYSCVKVAFAKLLEEHKFDAADQLVGWVKDGQLTWAVKNYPSWTGAHIDAWKSKKEIGQSVARALAEKQPGRAGPKL